MNVKTHVKAGKIALNHNATVTSGVAVKTGVKAGKISMNHNGTLLAA